MGKVICVGGLPGSGKTTFSLQHTNYRLVDDWHPSYGDPGPNTIVTSILFVDKNYRKEFEQFGYDIEWVFFENNPEQCILNCVGRDKMVNNSTIYTFSKRYSLPEECTVLPVFTKQPGDIPH